MHCHEFGIGNRVVCSMFLNSYTLCTIHTEYELWGGVTSSLGRVIST